MFACLFGFFWGVFLAVIVWLFFVVVVVVVAVVVAAAADIFYACPSVC